MVADTTSAAASSSGSGGMSGADIAGIVGTVVTVVGNITIAAKSEKEVRKLQEKLALLSLKQQEELAAKQREAASNIEKMRIFYQYLATVENAGAMADISRKKYIGIAILGTALIMLSVVIITARKKK